MFREKRIESHITEIALALVLFALSGLVLCSCESDEAASGNVQTVTLQSQDAASTDEAETSTTAESVEEKAEASDSSEVESSTTMENEADQSAEQEEPAAGGSATINLDDSAQYQQINLFLSNFSEVYINENPLDVANASDATLCGFTLWHTYRNSPDLVEHGSYYDEGLYHYNIRITQDRANELAMRYFGRSINFDNVNDMSQPYYCADGYVYAETTNGAGLPEGIALAKSTTDLGDGTVRIDFDIYFNATQYDTTDASLYGMSPADLMAYMGCDSPSRTGSAIVHYGEYNDYTGGLLLDYWEADRVEG
ncbi:MAG: hypothetical protein J5804_01790 [Eggerthellaceae bacterium]|nr:hypothetical protein [Eggerthellaceae bacterium]